MRNCRLCTNPIEQARLDILPDTVACASCANKHKLGVPRKGRMVFSHKTGGTLQIMSQELFNKTKEYYEPIGARSCVKNFSRNVCD